MILLSASGLGHAFGARPLFDAVDFTLSDGDRVGLIGPNGAGKSTLLKILAGELAPDRGRIARRGGLRVAALSQAPTFAAGVTVREAVLAGLPVSAPGEWQAEARVDELLAKLDLTGPAAGADAKVETLSGGWQKRVALACALAQDPELLLLDEPTNHLDVQSILWLEKLLAGARFATVTVTHDRLFLQRIANRILELDRRNAGGLLDVPGDYATYLDRKAAAMAAQERHEDVLRNTLRRETEWLRRGPQGRATKQQARIQRAGTLADEVGELAARNQARGVDLDFQGVGKKPRRLIEARGIGKSYGERRVFDDMDLFIGPGTRLGLLGANGCGKSTLLRVLTGAEAPTTGTVLRADDIRIATFEQSRDSLDPEQTLCDAICPIGDHVDFRGTKVHRFGYLERFMFRPEQMNMQLGRLSGGEQSRVLIARLMLRPASILVLDEPTNDLDLPTLTVLEDALTGFAGAVLLVTHDRYFLDRVATKILAFHSKPGEEGRVTAFADLQQWEEWYPSQTVSGAGRRNKSQVPPAPVVENPAGGGGQKRKKLGFNDQRDWDTLEARIAGGETRLAALQAECADPGIVSNGARLIEIGDEMTRVRGEIDALYTRWAELDTLRNG